MRITMSTAGASEAAVTLTGHLRVIGKYGARSRGKVGEVNICQADLQTGPFVRQKIGLALIRQDIAGGPCVATAISARALSALKRKKAPPPPAKKG